MNKNKTILILLPILALVLLIGGWSILKPKSCVSDGTRVCLSDKSGTFAIEDGAKIVVEVPTQAYGEALLALFSSKHTDKKEVLSFVVALSKDDPLPDLSYLTQNEAALRYATLLPVEKTLSEAWKKNLQWDKSSELNTDGLRFIPMSGSGFSFIYDATVLTRLGVDLSDTDRDGLPDAIDTVQKVTAIANKYLAEDKSRNYTSVFPIQFNEILSFYPLLTTGGWTLFPDDIATGSGFETPEFLKALQTIADLGASETVKAANVDAAKLVWQFDQVLTGNEFLFSMASDWMFVEAFEKRTNHDVRRARFPSFDAAIPAPLLNVEGYVVNTAKYQSAISEVLRLIRSDEGLSAFAKTSSATLLADPSILNVLVFDVEKQKDLALSYVHATSVPLVALKGNPAVLGFSMYRQLNFLPLVKQVFLGEISAKEAQKIIMGLAEDWVDANHGYPAEVVTK